MSNQQQRQRFFVTPDGSRFQRVGDQVEDKFGTYSNFTWLMVLSSLVAALMISYIVTTTVLEFRNIARNSENVKHISGVIPFENEITATAGLGLGFTPLPLINSFQYDNRGVVSINGLNSVDPTRDFTLAAVAPGLTLTAGASTLTFANGGVTSITAGTGITTNASTGDIAISTPAILTINGAPAVANDFLFAAGTAMGLTTVGNTVTYNNLGVTQVTAGAGIALSAATGSVTISTPAVLTINGNAAVTNDFQFTAGNGLAVSTTGNTATYSDSLADATQLADTDALGPLVRYEVAIGFFTPIAENAGWRTGVTPGFPMPFIPGSVEGGLGDVASTGWAVPAIGIYSINADCEVIPSAIAVNDLQIVSVAVTLAAQSEDPFALALIPAGGYATLDISSGTNANLVPALPRRVSVSSTFQAGCTGCLIHLGDALNIHMQMERAGVQPGPYTLNGYCAVQVSRLR